MSIYNAAEQAEMEMSILHDIEKQKHFGWRMIFDVLALAGAR